MKVRGKMTVREKFSRVIIVLLIITGFFMNCNEVSASESNHSEAVLKVGAYGKYEPIISVDQEGIPCGVLPEFLENVSKTVGVKFEYEFFSEVSSLEEAALNSNVDLMVASSDMKLDRLSGKRSEPLLQMPMTFVARIGDTGGVDKTWATIKDMKLPEWSDYGDIAVYSGYKECLDSVVSRRADFVYGPSWVMEMYLKQTVYHNLITLSCQDPGELVLISGTARGESYMSAINAAIVKQDSTLKERMISAYLSRHNNEMDLGAFLYANMIYIIAGVIILFAALVIFVMTRSAYRFKAQEAIARKAQVEEARYRVAAELSNDVLFEYDIKNDIMQNAERFKEQYGRNCRIEDFCRSSEESEFVHEEDRTVFSEYLKKLRSGTEVVEAQFRIMSNTGTFSWCDVRGKTILNEVGEPIKVIGRIANIDAQKRELERLQYKAQTDPFTGVLNKDVFAKTVEACLERAKADHATYAFSVIDIDNFKLFNDTYGHIFGDRVLKEIVDIMKQVFCGRDIIGRVGGDEFAILMKVTGRKEAQSKIERFMNQIRFARSIDDKAVNVTVSMGIAIAEDMDVKYDDVFRTADIALYSVKTSGKNSYSIADCGNVEYFQKEYAVNL